MNKNKTRKRDQRRQRAKSAKRKLSDQQFLCTQDMEAHSSSGNGTVKPMTCNQSELFQAINMNDISSFKRLIEGHTYVEFRDKEEFTLLHRAAQRRNPEFVELLLKKGADVESRARWKYTPLHEAASDGNVRTAKFLIDHGAKIDSYSDWAETPLIRALDRRKLNVFTLLLDHGANTRVLNYDGKSPLNMLVTDIKNPVLHKDKDDHIFMLKLIEKGARLETCYQGLTPLQHAMKNNKWKLASVLLSKGANPNVFDDCGHTPLHNAVLVKNYDLILDLLERHADVNALTKSEYRWAPLHLALRFGDKKMCKFLLKYEPNIHLEDSNKQSPSDLDPDKLFLTPDL